MLRRLLSAQRGGFSDRTSTIGLRRRNISTSIFGYTISGTPKHIKQPRQAGSERNGLFGGAREGLGIGIAILLSIHIFFDHGYNWSSTWGPSMLPTLNASGTSVIVSKWYRRGRGIQVGDIVSYKHPIHGEITTIKRVIGMPGDFVLRDTPGKGDGTMIQVPVGHCWTVGDNLAASRDSRMYGPVPLALIKGKVVAIWNDWLEMPQPVHNALRDYNDAEDVQDTAIVSKGA
ncbi:LexA/Signal peptidase, partial [Aureobasidium melanogenum]